MVQQNVSATRQTKPGIIENLTSALEGGDGEHSNVSWEFPLYSDAHIPGGMDQAYGPYQIINGRSGPDNYGVLRPVLVLRMDDHLVGKFASSDVEKSNTALYHGGQLVDEVAALISLSLGIRLKAGNPTRFYLPGDDPKGLPYHQQTRHDPILYVAGTAPIIPEALGTHDWSLATPWKGLATLPAKTAAALIRAARQFQEGLWIAEADPEQAWLRFVSAAETAAFCWKAAKETPLEKLRFEKPELVDILIEKGGDHLAERVAKDLAATMGSTKKFIDFIVEFLPAAPTPRLNLIYQHTWQINDIQSTMKKIYGYRSKALHEGIPFPAPVCMSPSKWSGIPDEVVGRDFSGNGVNWKAVDLPLYLHTFAYIVQHVLLAWWQSAIPQPSISPESMSVRPSESQTEAPQAEAPQAELSSST